MLRRIIRYTLFAIVSVAVCVAICIALVIQHLDDAYAQWGAADMVINYMEDHDGQWPHDWDDLRPYFRGGRVSGWSYDEFQRHVWIDFSADPTELRKLSKRAVTPPFNVIDSTSVFGPQFDDGPNGMLLRYFNPNAPAAYTTVPPAPEPMN